MNKKINSAAVFLFISLLSVGSFWACDKDTNCYLDVNVLNGSSSKAISGARVETYQKACDSTDNNYTSGKTDGSGVYSATFSAPGIMKVRATVWLDTMRNDGTIRGYRRGEATVRLVEGDTKTCNIHVPTDTLWATIAK